VHGRPVPLHSYYYLVRGVFMHSEHRLAICEYIDWEVNMKSSEKIGLGIRFKYLKCLDCGKFIEDEELQMRVEELILNS
jgi:hypothetical protein